MQVYVQNKNRRKAGEPRRFPSSSPHEIGRQARDIAFGTLIFESE